jgi:prefoldin subunit 5
VEVLAPEIETARELATHANDIKHLQDDMDRLVSDMEAIKQSLQNIDKKLSQAEGGWKVLMFIGAVSNIVTGLLVHFFGGKS